MGFDWEEILDSGDTEDAWYSAVYDTAQATGGWKSAFANTFMVNELVDEDFLLDRITTKTAKNGKPYFVVTLQRTEPFDTIKACLFSTEGVTEADAGKTAHVRGTVILTQGNLYLKIKSFVLLDEKDPAAPISGMTLGSQVDGRYTLRNISVKTASSGNDYVSGLLEDASGRILLRVWNYTGSLSEKDNGKLAAVKGTVTSFKDALRVEAQQITVID